MPSQPPAAATNLEGQIRSQPEELEHLLGSNSTKAQVTAAVERIRRCNRIWLVGTGTSQHAAELGAAMFQDAGRSAQWMSSMRFVDWAPVLGPKDALLVITHTGETAYALSALGQSRIAGLSVIPITKRGLSLPGGIETVDKETSETYTVSYTTALLLLAMIAAELGADSLSPDILHAVPAAVRAAIQAPAIEAIPQPERLLVIAGVGPAAITAREGALKVREASRFLSEGYDAEYLLHGSAVPLTDRDRLVLIAPPDDAEGFLRGVGRAAEGAGIPVVTLSEPSDLPVLLAQIPLTARLQLLALEYATQRGEDPDTVITGSWADADLWAIGAPTVT